MKKFPSQFDFFQFSASLISFIPSKTSVDSKFASSISFSKIFFDQFGINPPSVGSLIWDETNLLPTSGGIPVEKSSLDEKKRLKLIISLESFFESLRSNWKSRAICLASLMIQQYHRVISKCIQPKLTPLGTTIAFSDRHDRYRVYHYRKHSSSYVEGLPAPSARSSSVLCALRWTFCWPHADNDAISDTKCPTAWWGEGM